MFNQIRNSNPKFKLALNKSSSHKKRFGASAGKENVAPKPLVKPLVAKGCSFTGECPVKNTTNKKIQKRPSGYLADVSSDSLNSSDLADSILDDSIIQDWDEESSFNIEATYTSTPRCVVKRAAQFAFKLEENDVPNESFNLSSHLGYHSADAAFDTIMYNIVANDSVELTKKRLPSIVTEGDEDEDEEREETSYMVEGIVANDSIESTRKRVPPTKAQNSDEEDAESDFFIEEDSKCDADTSSSEVEAVFSIPAVTAPSDGDLMQETEQDVEYEYEDEEDLEWDLPGIIVTSPSDGDIMSTVEPIVELDYMSIVDQGCKYFLLDGTLHNWNLRFNTGEIFPDHDLRASGRIEAAGIQLLVSSPSDGDLRFENNVEREFEVEDIMDHSYKHHLLDASFHNWSMRFNFENYVRELEESDDGIYDEDEVY